MKNLAIILVIAALIGSVIMASAVKLRSDLQAAISDATVPITEESVREHAVRVADTELFVEPVLDDMIQFDPTGYNAVGERPDLLETAPALAAWRARFNRWTHLTLHDIFEVRTGYEFGYCSMPRHHRD